MIITSIKGTLMNDDSKRILTWFITFWAALLTMKIFSVEVGIALLIAEVASISWRLR